MTLTDEQISVLDGCLDEFRAADYRAREKIVQELSDSFRATRALPRGAKKFDNVIVKTVRALFSTLGCSQPFLAYSPAPLSKKDTGNKSTRFKYPYSGG